MALRDLAFLADHLAFARGQRVKEGVETGVAVVFPMELLGDAVKCVTVAGQRFGLLGGAKGDVQRGKAIVAGDPDGGVQQQGSQGWIAKETLAGGGGEGHGGLQFGVVGAAGILQSLGPAVIEDVFALRVGFDIKRHRGYGLAVLRQDQGPGLPAGAFAGGAGAIQSDQKAVAGERVDRNAALGVGHSVPIGGGNRGHSVQQGDFVCHVPS